MITFRTRSRAFAFAATPPLPHSSLDGVRHVRLEWARKLGLKSFEPGGPYDKALDAVCERLGVSPMRVHVDRNRT